MIESGTKLRRYEIRSKMGAGGMGEVYRARDIELGRDVAVKVLPSLPETPERQQINVIRNWTAGLKK